MRIRSITPGVPNNKTRFSFHHGLLYKLTSKIAGNNINITSYQSTKIHKQTGFPPSKRFNCTNNPTGTNIQTSNYTTLFDISFSICKQLCKFVSKMGFSLLNNFRLTHSASELSELISTTSLAMGEKFRCRVRC